MKKLFDDSYLKDKIKKIKLKENPPKPFIPWVGGKRRLLPELQKRLPDDKNSYFEPFIGGGALMWTVDKNKFKRIVINDYNPELANLYRVVKEHPEELINDLKKHKNTKEYYYKIRNMDRDLDYESLDYITKASRFFYIIKTCFNGLCDVNQKGQVTVGFANHKNLKIVDEDTILSCSAFLKDVEILNGNFDIIRPMLDEKSFVYLDPPYAKMYDSSFVEYTNKRFTDDMQLNVKEFCDYIDEIGAKFMMSNSTAPLIYELYKDYNIEEVSVARRMGRDVNSNGKTKEVIVRNYE